MELHLYLGLKLLHVLAVVLFLGNITTGVFWKANADRTRNPVVIANMLEGIIRADRLFTIPPIALILAGGIGAAVVGKYPILGTGWIFWSIVLFTISGIAFMAVVGPAQRKMLALVRRSGESLDWAAYRALSLQWEIWGAIALLAPAIAAALMVMKPAIPGLGALLGR
ncbi:MAG: DUF2269 family protein [Candidatus Eisenbacteria bacterium]|uniref:DUF2269 family protein n=2 Tax=Eiseniibacteriota bacterium TaxID=2212470 RepID=A0A538S6T1_UNCEI|nr:MAG: DUF2269 family protein [Candidatus Eisenbacteria bacterium]